MPSLLKLSGKMEAVSDKETCTAYHCTKSYDRIICLYNSNNRQEDFYKNPDVCDL